jgi:hypothetical protein
LGIHRYPLPWDASSIPRFFLFCPEKEVAPVRKYYLAIEKKYYELRQTLVSRLEQDYREVCNVYHQMENYRIKYINLLDKLENKGMKIKEIWELSKVDRDFLTEYRQKMITDKKAYREGGWEKPVKLAR